LFVIDDWSYWRFRIDHYIIKHLRYVTIDDYVCEEICVFYDNFLHTDMNEINKVRHLQICLNEAEWKRNLQICLKIVCCLIIIHTDMKIIDHKMTERVINEIDEHHFNILNEIEWDHECFSIREIVRVWEQWQEW
jgi:hypothetical protein